MSIDITVGSFAHTKDGEFVDDDYRKRYFLQFAAINRYLRSIGLPEHHEPERIESKHWFRRTGTRTHPELMSIAWNLEKHVVIRFPHLLGLSENRALYLPILFEDVLRPPPKFGIEIPALGSAVKLFEECRLLAKVLGIYDIGPDGGLEDDNNCYGQVAFSRDPLVLMLESLLDLNNKETIVPFSQMKQLMLSWYPGLAEDPWAVTGAIGCWDLYDAAKFSLKHKAAVVIS